VPVRTFFQSHILRRLNNDSHQNYAVFGCEHVIYRNFVTRMYLRIIFVFVEYKRISTIILVILRNCFLDRAYSWKNSRISCPHGTAIDPVFKPRRLTLQVWDK